ncbi:MAG: hypothetical protein LBS20_19680 [Prevotella sp.]|jgi:hypothetical protein|nr:hypothetical protein [Prevotella sp.]
MKRTNIQRDIESRKNMEEKLPPVTATEMINEPETQETDAESEIVQECETDKEPTVKESKKRGRSPKGDT